jgi:glycogen(starch) synthase
MDKLFEVSWEVCNKVGGIYTVITSKIPYMKHHIEDYFLVGPYLQENIDFEEKGIPIELKGIFSNLEQKGIRCHYGKWKNAKTILIDFSELKKNKNSIKKELWDVYGIDSIKSDLMFDDPMVWGYAVGMFLQEVEKNLSNQKIVGQFHEWLTGSSILYLKKNKSKIATIFTTHATVLERAMASSGEIFQGDNSDAEAYKRNVNDKHQVEKATAKNCDIFTAVSETVADSCERVLGRRPEVIVLNGMDIRHFPNMEEIPKEHKKDKEKIKDFLMAYFFPYYYFDLENTLIYFISGRYEMHAKGIDTYIRALGRLNERLKEEKSKKNIVAFLFIPTETIDEDIKIVESMIFLKSMKDSIDEYSHSMKKKILSSFLSGQNKNLFDEDFKKEIKRFLKIFTKKGNLPITTHKLKDKNDAIINEIKRAGLKNQKEDKVKVVFYPAYLGRSDSLLNMEYYDVVNGCHLGIFPSFYEPWGYTPVESAARGVPAITTNLSGFGKYVKENLKNGKPDEKGIIVIDRQNKNDEETIKELEEWMYWYLKLPKIQRIKNKIIAETFVKEVSWDNLIHNYFDAYKKAIKKTYG